MKKKIKVKVQFLPNNNVHIHSNFRIQKGLVTKLRQIEGTGLCFSFAYGVSVSVAELFDVDDVVCEVIRMIANCLVETNNYNDLTEVMNVEITSEGKEVGRSHIGLWLHCWFAGVISDLTKEPEKQVDNYRLRIFKQNQDFSDTSAVIGETEWRTISVPVERVGSVARMFRDIFSYRAEIVD